MKINILNFLKRPNYIYIIYIIAAIASSVSKYLRGPLKYNNFLIFKNVFRNTLLHQNIYLEYPEYHFDKNHYGILFSFIIAPFVYLPDWLALLVWNLSNTLLFIYAINQLPFSDRLKSFFAWLCLQEMITALLSFQFNVALTALIILSACYIYKRKELLSASSILIGFFVKIYGIVGLSSFFFIKNKKKFVLSFFIVGILFIILPMTISPYSYVIHSYKDWYTELIIKNQDNQVLGNMQDISLMGFVRRILNDSSISNITFLAFGLPLFGLPYFRTKQYKYLPFQLLILASTLLFTVLFSSSAESSTYIIAISGVMIWYLIQKKYTYLTNGLLIFVLLLTCFGMSDLFPKYVKDNYIVKYSLKALPCILVWFKIIFELMFNKFDKDYKLQ